MTENYIIGKTETTGKFFLSWAVERQELPITDADTLALRSAPQMLDHDPVYFSKQLWAYLNLALGQGEQRVVFNNVDSLNGLEAWRRIVVPLDHALWRISTACTRQCISQRALKR